MEFYEQLLKAKREHRGYVLVTVVDTRGETPRAPGAKLLVLENGELVGTVGGGIVEKRAVADCAGILKEGKPCLRTYSTISMDDPDEAMAAENTMTLFFEPGLRPPCLYLCGCGHVAQAVLPLAKRMGYTVIGIDARDVSAFKDALTELDELILLGDFAEIEAVPVREEAAYLVASYSHQTDGIILREVLRRRPAYVGMLGGPPKIRTLFTMLRDEGVSEETLRSVHAPVGLDLGDETPAEIAVSIMAEILATRNHRSARPMSDLIRERIFPL
ncbi:MAG: XdhC family protein [Clostridia bacterium]|nr:XdhC family protein [Clostridia bacterium]